MLTPHMKRQKFCMKYVELGLFLLHFGTSDGRATIGHRKLCMPMGTANNCICHAILPYKAAVDESICPYSHCGAEAALRYFMA
ncbi:hypothetical protein BKA63DRAFT_523217 [Paraphoma chrysanthemicola]|nr:hypothetical protein BKA63DRAFT_523217 [Paraphoma chrysanthemicola]